MRSLIGTVRYSRLEFPIAKNQNTYAKRQREQEKKQRADDKRAKRDRKKNGPDASAPSYFRPAPAPIEDDPL